MPSITSSIVQREFPIHVMRDHAYGTELILMGNMAVQGGFHTVAIGHGLGGGKAAGMIVQMLAQIIEPPGIVFKQILTDTDIEGRADRILASGRSRPNLR